MKDFLLIVVVLFVIVALFGDGGLEISPTISPSLDAAFNTALDVTYAPDRSVETTTIETQVLGDFIESQTLVMQPVSSVPRSNVGGSSVLDGRPGGACFTVPGDVIVEQGSNGECQVINANQRYFVAPGGTRSWLRSQDQPEAGVVVQPPSVQIPPVSNDGRWMAVLPLDQLTTAQMKENFKRNGGELPLGFRFWTDEEQRTWLTAKPEAWR